MEMWGTELDTLKPTTPKELGKHYAYELDEMERAISGEDDAGHGFSWVGLALGLVLLGALCYGLAQVSAEGYHQ